MTVTAPLAARCGRCGARVLEVRWDWALNTICGTPRLDPVALTTDQVVACIIADLPTWQLYFYRRQQVTSRRDRWWPSEPIGGEVLPEHHCGRTWDAPPATLIDPTTIHAIPDVCPF